jgi:hypothetical protein
VDITRIITIGGIVLTVLSVLVSLFLLRREQRIRLRWDFLRVLFTAGGIAGAILLMHVEPRLEYLGIAAGAGLVFGTMQGRALDVRIVEGFALGRRTVLAMLAWGIGIIAMQAAAYLNRADVVEYALVGSAFGAGLALGTFIGSGRAVRVARKRARAVPAAATAAALLILLALGTTTSAVAQEQETNPHAGTYTGVVPVDAEPFGTIGQAAFAMVIDASGNIDGDYQMDGSIVLSESGVSITLTFTSSGTCDGFVDIEGTASCSGFGTGSATADYEGFPQIDQRTVPFTGAITGTGFVADGVLTAAISAEGAAPIEIVMVRDPATAPVTTTTTSSTSSTSTTAPATTDATRPEVTTTLAPTEPVVTAPAPGIDPAEEITEEEAAAGGAATAAAALASLLSTLPAVRPARVRPSDLPLPEAPPGSQIEDPHRPGTHLPVNDKGQVWYGDWVDPAEAQRRIGGFHEEERVRARIEENTRGWRERQEEFRRNRRREEQLRLQRERDEQDLLRMLRDQMIRISEKKVQRSGDKYDQTIEMLITNSTRPDGSFDPEKIKRYREIMGQRIQNDLRIPPEEYRYDMGDVLRQTGRDTFHDARRNPLIRAGADILSGGLTRPLWTASDMYDSMDKLHLETPLDQDLSTGDYVKVAIRDKVLDESPIPTNTLGAVFFEGRMPTVDDVTGDIVDVAAGKVTSSLNTPTTSSTRGYAQNTLDKINDLRQRSSGNRPVKPWKIPGNLPEELQNVYHDNKEDLLEATTGLIGDQIKDSDLAGLISGWTLGGTE